VTVGNPSPKQLGTLVAALTERHRISEVGERSQIRMGATPVPLRHDVIIGAGFIPVRGLRTKVTTIERVWSLPDTMGPDMQILICGLNPSPSAADDGIGFAKPGNRFWPAALQAGIVSRDRDADHALQHHGIGMTDLVKRTTPKASELTDDEYRFGLERIERLASVFQPGSICFVGLAGWRVAVDRKATAGWQSRTLGAIPVYVMPSTSGLNASTQLPGFVTHLRNAALTVVVNQPEGDSSRK